MPVGDHPSHPTVAALWDLPVVMVCQNYMYAEMTPVDHTMKIEHVAARALGYGMLGVRVDGNDSLALVPVLSEAVERARTGGGPTFVEAVTFRFRGHYFGDPTAYIPNEQMAAAEAADPLRTLRSHLRQLRAGDRRRRRPIPAGWVGTSDEFGAATSS